MHLPLSIITFALIGALVAIACHQVALGRADRSYYFAALWSLWSGGVLLSYWILHLPLTERGTVAASRVFFTTLGVGGLIALLLARNLYEGTVSRRHSVALYVVGIASAVAPLGLHLVLPEKQIWIRDLLTEETPFATIGAFGALGYLPAVAIMVQIQRWMRSPQVRHRNRVLAARTLVKAYALVGVNDALVIVGGVNSILLFPFLAALQAFLTHSLLIAENTRMLRSLEEMVDARTAELAAQRGELRRASENLDTMMSGLPDGVIAATRGAVVFANVAAGHLLGIRPENLQGARLDWCLPGEVAEQVAAVATPGHHIGPIELVLPRGDSKLDLEIDALGIELAGNDTVLVILRDVSERARMRAQLLRSDRLASLGTLAAGVGHEINNPLSYVLNNIEFVRETVEGDGADELRSALDDAVDGVRRISAIVAGMKSFARPEVANLGDVDLRDVANDALKLTRHTIEHQATLELRLDAVPMTRANRAQLGQIAVNLLMNAVQARRPGATSAHVAVITKVGGAGEVRLEIHDNGVGMSHDVRVRAFDPFFTTKPIGAGTGLGLSICHGIASAFGGRIELDSVEGRGTVASLVMPSSASTRSTPVAPPQLATDRTARVLIIDDEPAVASAMKRMLREHHVEVATGVPQIETALRDSEYDLVLCDLMMPGMTGMELHARLARERPAVADRMVFVTGGAFTPSAVEFVERMRERCVDKPLTSAALRALVSEAIARRL